MRGRVGAVIARGAGFNPIGTGRENVYVSGSVLGLSKQEVDARIEEIIQAPQGSGCPGTGGVPQASGSGNSTIGGRLWFELRERWLQMLVAAAFQVPITPLGGQMHLQGSSILLGLVAGFVCVRRDDAHGTENYVRIGASLSHDSTSCGVPRSCSRPVLGSSGHR